MTPRLLRYEAKYVQRNVRQLEQEGQHPLTGQCAGYWPIRLLRIFVLLGARDSDVRLIFQDVLILCLYRLYVDFFQ